ncbi:MAG TPA: glycosyl hydrolase [Mycobacteriales bacterium]|nr:glycosyl hydrolase [Mycobacteriales bacterium]
MSTSQDPLAGIDWECGSTPPGLVAAPIDLDRAHISWMGLSVPGTAAQALVDTIGDAALWANYDGLDWWFRCRFDVPDPARRWVLRAGGLATIADVWLNGTHILHSENMFVEHEADVGELRAANEIVIRCAALDPLIAQRRPRPRWRSPRLIQQNLRWFRTTLMGRLVGWVVTPPPVGPWRPVSLTAREPLDVRLRSIRVGCDEGSGGFVDLEVEIEGYPQDAPVRAQVASVEQTLELAAKGATTIARGRIDVTDIERWWPHTHGDQPRYEVTVSIGDLDFPVRTIGFRTIEVDRSDHGFTLVCNGVPIFCRGACWMPPDPVRFSAPVERVRRNFDLFREAGLNMVRLVGEVSYENEEFLDLCDEMGILLWQDAMLAFFDAPDDDGYTSSLEAELEQVFSSLQGRPSLAVVCGGSDTEEQAQFMGGPPERWISPVAYNVIPDLLERLLPGTPYIASSPGESPLPTMINQGVAHYYGVGAYTRPISDARRATVRFAAECLSFATPPEPIDSGELPVTPRPGMGHHAEWKNAIHNDAHASWDQEDVRDFYTHDIFDVDLFSLRHHDPERAMALARATSAYVFDSVLTEWRRAGSGCWGSLVFNWHDLRFGAGLGVIDSHDRPKASWYAMRRVMQPVAILFTDEGLNGLGLHLVNDAASDLTGTVRLELVINAELKVESTEVPVSVPARGGCSVETGVLLGGFRDLSYAHQFGKAAYDAVVATLMDGSGKQLSQAVYFPTPLARPVELDLGLEATVRPAESGPEWIATVSTKRLAQWVSLEVPEYAPLDGWFHLPPGETREVVLLPLTDNTRDPAGNVRALNLARPTRLRAAP